MILSAIQLAPLLPAWSIILLGALAAILALFAAARATPLPTPRPYLAALLLLGRLGLLAGIVLILLNPGRRDPATAHASPTGRPRLALLLDTSASMRTPDAHGQPRLERALRHWLTPDSLSQLRAAFDLRLIAFDADTRPFAEADLARSLDQLPAGAPTRLAAALTQTLASFDPATPDTPQSMPRPGILLITDGRDTTVAADDDDTDRDAIAPPDLLAALAQQARRRSLALHALVLGRPDPQPHVAILGVAAPRLFAAGQTATVHARIEQQGYDQTILDYRLRVGADTTRGRLEIDGRRLITLPLSLRAPLAPGPFVAELTVEPPASAPGSAPAPQGWTFVGRVVAEPIRTLLLEGDPSWEMPFLARALARDPGLRVRQFTRLSDDTLLLDNEPKGEPTSAPPVAALVIDWTEHDVVVLGRRVDRLLDPAAARRLAAWVRAGGRLLFLRGQPLTPASDQPDIGPLAAALAPLTPVVWPAEPQSSIAGALGLTPAGLAHPALQPAALGLDLAPFLAQASETSRPIWIEPVAAARPAATVLATAALSPSPGRTTLDAAMPAWATMPIGRGLSLILAGQGWWQWAMRPPDDAGPAHAYDALFTNLVRCLALGDGFSPREPFDLAFAPARPRVGQEIALALRARAIDDADPGLPPALTITDPVGRAHAVPVTRRAPGRHVGSFRAELPGLHRARASTAALPGATNGTTPATTLSTEELLFVRADDAEARHPACDAQAMRALTDSAAGLCVFDDDTRLTPAAFFARLAQPPNAAASRPAAGADMPRSDIANAGPHRPIWNHPWVLALLLSWLALEWLTRRRVGWA